MNIILEDLLMNLRKAIALLAIDNCELHQKLVSGYKIQQPPACTVDRVILSAYVLGLLEENANVFSWKSSYIPVIANNEDWKKTIDIIKHHETYLNLASIVNSSTDIEKTTPKQQLAANPNEYFRFLGGVEASHHNHAEWFASIGDFEHLYHLIDLGGGLGTFSLAWVNSNQKRKAMLIDFPEIEGFLLKKARLNDRLVFLGMDLNECSQFEFQGDVYLLANILHLLPNWRRILFHVVDQIPPKSLLAILEANSSDKAGILFDFQVHLRSGGYGGLISTQEIDSAIVTANLRLLKKTENSDINDPFQRNYILWICQK